MEKKFDIISVCEPVMDYAVAIDRIPGTDSIAKMYAHLFQSGGNAASAITAAARLGAKCAVIGTVGNDPCGEFCREDMVYHGVDVSRLFMLEGTTQYAVCLAEKETQGRSFLGLEATVQKVTDDMLDEEFIASAKYLHLDCVDMPGKWTAAEMARKNGCRFVDNETPYERVPQGHPTIVDYFYHEEVRGTANSGRRNK